MMLKNKKRKKKTYTLTSHHTPKLTPNGIQTYVRVETIKLLDKNIGESFCDLGLGKDFLYMTPKHNQSEKKIDNTALY